jgi:hypothetical protein
LVAVSPAGTAAARRRSPGHSATESENAMAKHAVAAITLAFGLVAASDAFADRAPTPEERSRIESVLRAEGFQRWDDIELDDGVWEVDDAVGPDGREYDLKLDPNTFAIIERKPD